MRVKLPRGRSLEGGLLASFEQERDRLDNMMSKGPLAQGMPSKTADASR